MKNQALLKLKTFLKDQKIDFFLLQNSDQFFSEILPASERKIEFLTGFSGSNAVVIFGQEKSYFFTDGRYILQAKNQLDLNEFEIFNIAETPLISWIKTNIGKEKSLALDPKLSSVNFFKSISEITTPVILGQNGRGSHEFLFEELRLSKSSARDFVGHKIFPLPEKLSGLDSIAKRQLLLRDLESDALLISKPENLCWLLNIRSADLDSTPLCLAYGILFKSGEVDLFIDEKRLKNLDLPQVNIVQPDCLDLRLAVIRKNIKKIQIDASATNYWLYRELEKNNFEISVKIDPCEILKAQKNSAEINGAIKSHEVDGLALTKFLFWLEKNEGIDELKAVEKLLEFRQQNKNFFSTSFDTISSFASNGAVIHYRATPATNKKIQGDSLFLLDSGGQYFGEEFCGTTDVTRTIAIGNPTAEMIENFTRVLKGHIALARVKFPAGTSGAQLDALARFHLWQAGLDYDHGTGHGVGSFLSVHEGPCGISKRAHQQLLPGMILSNEPGFYKEGEYGIRIENLMLVEKCDEKFLQFKTLTLAPIDPALIDFKMLTYPEKKWLKEYHESIFEVMNSGLDDDEKNWLLKILKKFFMPVY